jgi:diguanylate cyclase (GGDEF)-like protein/PAS domain S-box-containing protein
MHLLAEGDGIVLAALYDRTDQFRLDGILRAQNTVAQMFDSGGTARWVSPQASEVIGEGAGNYVGMHWSEIVHADDHHLLERAVEELTANPGAPVVVWYRSRHPVLADTWWPTRSTLTNLADEPAAGGIVTWSRMVDASDEAAKVHGRADMTAAEIMPGAIIISAAGRIQFHNRVAHRMLGASVEAVDAYQWVDHLHSGYRAEVREALLAAATGVCSTVTAPLDRPDGGRIWVRIDARPSFDAVRTQVGYSATLLDVTAEHDARQEMERTQAQLWQLANHDSLTGLPNRLQFNERVAHALAGTRRDGRAAAVLFCDLDRFKQVNDAFGHAGGDALLIEIARRFRASIREIDTVCRLGGDEFVVICEGFDDLSSLEAIATRLIATVNGPVRLPAGEATVGLSIGIAVASPTTAADELLRRADAAVYEAKANGRNCFVTATP